jgi:hypothetical protein
VITIGARSAEMHREILRQVPGERRAGPDPAPAARERRTEARKFAADDPLSARDLRVGPVCTTVPVGAWDRVRDRAVVLPS